jgi:hypothetical protein
MILDSLLAFDPGGTAINTGAPATYNSTNVLDLHLINGGIPVLANGQGARDIGIGDDNMLQLMVLVTTTFTSGGAGTLQVNFQGAPDNGAGAPGTWTTYSSTEVYALAALIAGARLMDQAVPRPPAGVTFPRFLRLTYVVGTAAFTAGAFESFIVGQRFDQPEITNAVLSGYPAGITVAN